MRAIAAVTTPGETAALCHSVGLARASFYRRRRPTPSLPPPPSRAPSPRALAADERQAMLDTLHSERFVDQSPAEVHATLLEEQTYLGSVRTMYRVLAEAHEGFCCNVWDHARESVGWTSLHGQSEHLVDQPRLTDHVALRHPPRLSLAERMHHLDTADGPPRRGELLEPQHRPGAAFDESMVLLDDVVQILALAERRTWSEQSLVFDGLERDRVGGVLVHVHDARGRRMRRTDRLAEERDGRIPVARGPEQEIQRVPVGINAPVKIVPGPADTHVRLVDSIRIRGASQEWPAPLVDLWRIALHRSPTGMCLGAQLAISVNNCPPP